MSAPPLAFVAWLLAAAVACHDPGVSRSIGARCDDSAACDDRCLLPGDGWPGGFCTVSCDDVTDCPEATTCADLEGGVCLWACDDAAACAALGTGWRCAAVPGRPAREVFACVGP